MVALEQYRAAVIAVVVVVLLGLGGVIGGGAAYWLTADHYRPIVEGLRDDVKTSASTLASCRTTSSTLEGQVGQQNQALADLQRATDDRTVRAQADQQQADKSSSTDYQAANRLQQERTGGDPAETAAAIIDKELGL